MPLFGRYAKAVRGLFGLEATQVGILPELLPVVEVMPADGTTQFIRGEYIYGSFIYRTAIAGQYSTIVCRNPATSSRLACMELIEVWSTGAAIGVYLRSERGGSAAATVATVGARDPRVWSDVPPYPIPHLLEVSHGGVAALAGTTVGYLQTGGANLKDAHITPIIVVPGTSLYVMTSAVNTTVNVNLQWFERNIDGAEYG